MAFWNYLRRFCRHLKNFDSKKMRENQSQFEIWNFLTFFSRANLHRSSKSVRNTLKAAVFLDVCFSIINKSQYRLFFILRAAQHMHSVVFAVFLRLGRNYSTTIFSKCISRRTVECHRNPFFLSRNLNTRRFLHF